MNSCLGVGHASCRGGDLPLNNFGIAFRDANYAWTNELCNSDSDGDGFSNGVELGDPCCLFGTDIYEAQYAGADTVVTHPGFSHSNPIMSNSSLAAMDDTDIENFCSSYKRSHDSKGNSEETGDPYLSHEDKIIISVELPELEIPQKETLYRCTFIDLSQIVPDSNATLHMVGFKALIDNEKLTHHMLMRGCREMGRFNHMEELVSTTCFTAYSFCEDVLGGWSPGGNIDEMFTHIRFWILDYEKRLSAKR